MTRNELAKWRSYMNLSQHEAAEKLDISTRTYSRYENGDTEIPKVMEMACFHLFHRHDIYLGSWLKQLS